MGAQGGGGGTDGRRAGQAQGERSLRRLPQVHLHLRRVQAGLFQRGHQDQSHPLLLGKSRQGKFLHLGLRVSVPRRSRSYLPSRELDRRNVPTFGQAEQERVRLDVRLRKVERCSNPRPLGLARKGTRLPAIAQLAGRLRKLRLALSGPRGRIDQAVRRRFLPPQGRYDDLQAGRRGQIRQVRRAQALQRKHLQIERDPRGTFQILISLSEDRASSVGDTRAKTHFSTL